MFGVGFEKGISLNKRISEYCNVVMNHFGYYKINDLQIWGYCELCGKPMNGVFEKDWPVGICNDCAKLGKD